MLGSDKATTARQHRLDATAALRRAGFVIEGDRDSRYTFLVSADSRWTERHIRILRLLDVEIATLIQAGLVERSGEGMLSMSDQGRESVAVWGE